jgi:uncharacterized protein (TIGR03435 family)
MSACAPWAAFLKGACEWPKHQKGELSVINLWAMWRYTLAIVIVLAATALQAQETPKRSFEVATVKTCDPNAAAPNAGMTPGRMNLPCLPLKALISIAYGEVLGGGALGRRPIDVVGGPGWLATEFFAVTAKAEGAATTKEMIGPMLRSLLEERFLVRAHKESKEVPDYALVVAKPNPKLAPTPEGSCTPIDINNTTEAAFRELGDQRCGAGEMHPVGRVMVGQWHGITLDEFADRLLTSWVRRPVINQTGLTGRYNFKLEFTPETTVMRQRPDQPPADVQESGPSVFTALQEQLGLKLVAEKGSVEVIAVDHVEKLAEN